MKFSFNRNAILKEIAVAQEIIASKNPLSISSNILLEAYDGKLTIKSTDAKIYFVSQIPIDIAEEGATTVLCNAFFNVINGLPDGEASFILNNEKADIVAKKSNGKNIKQSLNTISSEKFPPFASVEDEQYFEISAQDFKELIVQTSFSFAADRITDSKPAFRGILIEKDGDYLTLASTDSTRFSMAKKEIMQGVADFPKIIVPSKALLTIMRHLPDEGNIKVAITETMIFFKFANYEFSSLLINDNFPAYQSLCEREVSQFFKIQKSDLSDALKRASTLMEKRDSYIRFLLTNGNLAVNASSADVGETSEDIECEYSGDNFEFVSNFVHVNDPLRVIDSDVVCFEFCMNGDTLTQIRVKADVESNDCLHIFAPIRR